MALVKCECLSCKQVHEWELGMPLGYPADFTGDKRVTMFREASEECSSTGQMSFESKVEKNADS